MKSRAIPCLPTTAVLVATLLTATTVSASDSTYSADPYSFTIRDVAENLVEFTVFNNWLNENYASAPAENNEPLREHLYTIIDSRAKQLYEQGGDILPDSNNIILSLCFEWASRMGAFGAQSILKELNPEMAMEVQSSVQTPPSFHLSISKKMFLLSSTWGDWSAVFPYHFMVGNLQEYRTNNDLQTQVAVVSTGFGRHADGEGYSQATILVAYSPEGIPESFREFWLESFGLSDAKAADELINQLVAFKKFDTSSNMNTEIVFPAVKEGAIAVVYMGLAGTYEFNRPHFLDFLKNLQLDKGD